MQVWKKANLLTAYSPSVSKSIYVIGTISNYLHASVKPLPAETTTSIPSFVAALTVSSNAWDRGPPNDMLMMIFLLLSLDLTAITCFIPRMMVLYGPLVLQPSTRVLNTLAALAEPNVLPATKAATWVPWPWQSLPRRLLPVASSVGSKPSNLALPWNSWWSSLMPVEKHVCH